ncbi:putative Prefoldin beta-like protein [Trachipleistophora hominis]|uniref:Putative Prefoldin beta-like protein n=1 Tax=Trachipleistophora hominis TaxID=72359 RepID=L7JYG6_TRAHO|nr:putative Prefoldin beta-like protein [Trachipleistophora hominis]
MGGKKYRDLLLQCEQIDYELDVISRYDGSVVYTKDGDVFIPMPKNRAIDQLEKKKKNIVMEINNSNMGRI